MNQTFNLTDIISMDSIEVIEDNYVVENKYSGNYTDLTNENEISILNELKKRNWKEVVHEKFKDESPWLYKIIIDKGRSLFLDLLNTPPDGVFLDVGSGWGQITIPLSERGNVVAMDLTENRLKILSEIAKQENSNVNYVQGNFLTFPFREKVFDLIIFNGSLEWIGVGRNEKESILEVQLKALKKTYTLLKPRGQIYIGIENSLGLKYILGTPDDHTAIPHLTYLDESVANQKYYEVNKINLPAKTWSLTEYKQLISDSGLKIEKIYACFPDYKIIRQMIDITEINKYLLYKGIPYNEHNGLDGKPIEIAFEQMNALYRLLAKNGVAQYFCPSYGIIARKDGE